MSLLFFEINDYTEITLTGVGAVATREISVICHLIKEIQSSKGNPVAVVASIPVVSKNTPPAQSVVKAKVFVSSLVLAIASWSSIERSCVTSLYLIMRAATLSS